MTNDNYWRNKNVFVTGCTGFLGSWIVRDLVDKGANVTGLIRDWIPKSNLILQGTINKINSTRGNITDYHLLEYILNEYEIDTVFHLSAQAIVGIASRNPMSTFDTNIRGTWNILEASRRTPTIKKIIVASSDKAYGEHNILPYTEDVCLKGNHPYDVSKSCADLIAYTYYNTYRLPVCITRCANFYGGGDLNFNRIVPGTIRSILLNERPIIRSDGSFVRDYLYIRDAVNAYIVLAEKMDQLNIHGEAFNFSNETQLTVLELTKKILNMMGRDDLEPIILNEAKGEIRYQHLSTDKAKNILGWKQLFTIEEGMKDTINWYREFIKYDQ